MEPPPPYAPSAPPEEENIVYPNLPENFRFPAFNPAVTPTVSAVNPGVPTQYMPAPLTLAPFRFDIVTGTSNLGTWLQSRWFTQSQFKEKVRMNPIQKYYMPFWCFNGQTQTQYTASVTFSTSSPNGQTIDTITTQQGYVTTQHVNIIAPAYNEKVHEFLKDFKDFQKAEFLKPNLYPDRDAILEPLYVDPKIAWERSVYPKIQKQEKNACEEKLKQLKPNKIRDLRTTVVIQSLYQNLVYFPIYLSSYTYETKLYKYAASGLSDEVHGERGYGFGAVGDAVSGLSKKVGGFLKNL